MFYILKINLLLAIGYLLGGCFGTLLSIPPSHASPIWPAAGIAFAGIVTYGWKVLPGIWLGALLAQVISFLDQSSANGLFFSLLIGGIMSVAATAQAAFGAWLTWRHVGASNPLTDDRSILGFIALGGPVSCMLSASVGVTTLYLNGALDWQEIRLSWLTWWIGDTIGVLIFAPLLLCFIGVLRNRQDLRISSIALPLIILSLMVFVILHLGKRHEKEHITALFDKHCSLLHNALQNAFARHIEINQNVKAFFDSSTEVNANAFSHFTETFLSKHPDIKALEWIPRIVAEKRSVYEQSLGLTFKIQASDNKKDIQPAPFQPEYFPVTYVNPLQGNERAVGLDISSKPNSFAAIKKARDTADTTMSGMIRLVQDAAGQPSAVIYTPVYEAHRPLQTREQRRTALRGFIANVFQVHRKINLIKAPFNHLQLLLKITDNGDELYNQAASVPSLALDFPKFEKTLPLTVADRVWSITYTAAPAFYHEQLNWNIWWLIWGCFMFTGLTGIGSLMLTGRTMQTENVVKIRTRELEKEIAERKTTETKLHRLTEFYAALSHCNQAIVRAADEKELFRQICHDAVAIGGIKMAWIGLIDRLTHEVTPVACAGEGVDYLESIRITADPANPISQGPAGSAIRENRPIWCQDFLHDPLTRSWQPQVARYPWGSKAALPIHKSGIVTGVFCLYANKVHAFDHDVQDLLERMAWDIGFALDNFEREAKRKHAEQALLESENRLMLAIKGSSDAPWDWDMERNCMYYSPQWWRMLGYETDELPSDAHLWLRFVHPDDIDFVQDSLQRAINSGQSTHAVEFRLRHKDGHYVPILERSFISRDNEGKVLRISGTNMDLTERRRSQSLEDLRSFMLECITSSMPLAEILDAIARKVESIRPGSLCSISLVDSEGSKIRLAAAPSLPEFYTLGIDGLPLSSGMGCCSHTALTGKKSVTDRIAGDPRCAAVQALTEQAGLLSWWSEPILDAGNDVLGTFAIYQRIHALPDDCDLKLIETVAHYTSLTIDRKRTETQLKLAAKVFEQSQEGFMITDAQHHIVKVNPAFTAITGYSEGEAIGRNAGLLASGRHTEEFYQNIWTTINTHNYWQGEIWNRRKDGEIYPELLNISAVRDNVGNINGYVGVFADITQLKASEAQLEFLAHHDTLTSLPNRLRLFFRLEHSIDAAQREGQQLALLMLDLDRFKDVNDSFGHLAGDHLLQLVAKRLVDRVRNIDTVARLGGDEFTVVLENIAHPEDAAMVAQAIIADLREPWSIPNSGEVLIGVSIGISLYPQHGHTPEVLLQHADAALYKAKEGGRNHFAFYSNEFTEAARQRIDLEARLRRALVQDELEVYYQPQIDIASGEIVGAEALVRWQDPAEGLILPGHFIHLAEQTGLIQLIGAWVLKETCRQGRKWLDNGFKPLSLAVNVSPHQLRQGDIRTLVADTLRETGYPAEYLELELTESGLMERQNDVIELLESLRAQGVRLAIDDFGTGYSSLSYLKRFPLDVLKIDKNFIDDIPEQQDDMEIAATIIAMGHILGYKVLAEGVETPEQLAFLKGKECDLYQGYLHSPPLPANEFTALLKAADAAPQTQTVRRWASFTP
ncbi:MAG: EAL domain-containing protein [Gammaproteobacteria bacterium]